ncbi:MAG: VOC family protein [Sphingomonas bacterium]
MSKDYLRLRQICLVAPDLEPAVDDMAAILGVPVCHRDPRVRVFGVENALFAVGTTFIEIIAPLSQDTAAARFLERSGGQGGYIALFDCPDPRRYEANANALGVPTAYTIDRPADYTAIQLLPRACRATMLEFDRSEGGEKLTGRYSPAGPGWQRFVDTRVSRAVTGIGAVSPAPHELGAHWAAILRRPLEGPTPAIAVDGARIGFEACDAGRERLEWVDVAAAQPGRIMEEARRRGRAVGERAVRLSGMVFRIANA